MVPAPQTTAPPPLQELQRSPAIPLQQTTQGGALTCGPFSFLQAGGRLPVPSWDFGGGTLTVSAQLAHPSRAPEQCLHPPPASTSSASSSAPLPTSAMFLLRPLPPKNQEGSVKSTPFPRSGLSPAPVREDPGGPRLPAGSRAGPDRCQASTFPAPGARRPAEHPFLRATSSAPHRPRPALQRVPTGAASQPFSPACIRLGPPRGRGHPGAELPRRRSHFANQDFACLPTL